MTNVTLKTDISDITSIIKFVVKEAINELNIQPKTVEPIHRMLSRKEAMEFLRVGATKFNDLRNEGTVIPIRLGRKTLYRLSDLLTIGAAA